MKNQKERLKIGYFGDGPWAHRALELLSQDPHIKICFVTPRYDVQDSVLRQLSQKYGVPFLPIPDVNDLTFVSDVQALGCDLLVSMSYNQIFRKPILSIPDCVVINCHAGKLPFYRGRNILNWALINDEKEFGVTVHLVDEGIDTGDIILQQVYPITDRDDYGTLLDKAHAACAGLLHEAVTKFRLGEVEFTKQSSLHRTGMYCGRRSPGDEVLNWNQTSRDVFNFVRAICRPGPQATTYCNGLEVKINRVELLLDAPTYKGKPGQVLCRVPSCPRPTFWVKTLDSFVNVTDYTGALKVGDVLTTS